YGHAGAYDTLEDMVRHHLDAVSALYAYDRSQVRLPPRADLDASDFAAMDDPAVVAAIAAANEAPLARLPENRFRELMDFLHALTDPAMLDLSGDIPPQLPSGLPLAD
ncbi:MAG: cytochrome-c peroxidase, partial [Gammaproteobacteria bacterium]|nr:cytochrome-c peroxidase [Gammaproteobacteria bacterium]